jgi:hypothetical protein
MPHSPYPKRPDEGLKWLDEVLEDEKPTVIRARKVPPLPESSSRTVGDAIEVDGRWLIPPMPSGKHGKTREAPPKRPQPALSVEGRRRGKLPPPLPR